jgi:hypothetical protein
MLERMGKTHAEIRAERHDHQVHWVDAVALTHSFFGGVQLRIRAMVQRSLETMPALWRQQGGQVGLNPAGADPASSGGAIQVVEEAINPGLPRPGSPARL